MHKNRVIAIQNLMCSLNIVIELSPLVIKAVSDFMPNGLAGGGGAS